MRFATLFVWISAALAGCSGLEGFGGNDASAAPPAVADGPRPSAYDAEAEREHAIDQLVGGWVYQVCDEDGNCEAVVRVYEESPETGLVRYTELYNGTENEGFVGYDLESDAFVEYDYPQQWSREEFEQRYMSEDESIALFGAYQVGHPDRRTIEWRIDEEGDTLYLRALGSELREDPEDALNVIFSRIPLVGSDPVIGRGSDD